MMTLFLLLPLLLLLMLPLLLQFGQLFYFYWCLFNWLFVLMLLLQ